MMSLPFGAIVTPVDDPPTARQGRPAAVAREAHCEGDAGAIGVCEVQGRIPPSAKGKLGQDGPEELRLAGP